MEESQKSDGPPSSTPVITGIDVTRNKTPKSTLKGTLLLTVLAVAFGTNFGIYNTSVVNNLKPTVVQYINETQPAQWLSFRRNDGNLPNLNPSLLWSIVVSAFTAGSALGTLASPALAERLGRRGGLLTSAILNAIGSMMCFFYLYLFELALFGRLLMGISLGLGIPLASAFITEVSPVDRRGQLNALLQTAFGLGDLCGMVFSIEELLGGLYLTPYALSFTVIFSIVQFVVICFAHESPRHLILKLKRLEEGKKSLEYYQGEIGCREEAIQEIQDENKIHVDVTVVNTQNVDAPANSNFWSNIKKKPMILACVLLTTTAFTGISPVMVYSTDAFLENGLPHYAQLCTVALGISNFFGSFVAIGLMESWGRKPLMVSGVAGCFCSITSFTIISLTLDHYRSADPYWSYMLVVCLIFFLLFFSLCGASNNTLAAEICPQTYRSTAVSLANFCMMFFSTILILLYEVFKLHFGHPWVFFPSSAISMLIGLYLIMSVPETKSKTLSELKQYFELK